MPADHKLRGSELIATTAGGDPAAEPGQQQARDTLYVPILYSFHFDSPQCMRTRNFRARLSRVRISESSFVTFYRKGTRKKILKATFRNLENFEPENPEFKTAVDSKLS